MKKLLLVLVFLASAFMAQAQLFVAGSLSAYHYDGATYYETSSLTEDLSPVRNGIAFAPAVGYMIPGKRYGMGLILSYAYASEKDSDRYLPDNGDVIVEPYKKSSNTYDIAPFLRYAYAKFDKITLYVDARMPISISNAKTKIEGDIVETREGDKTFSIGGRLIPGLTYRFTPHILFTTEIGLLSVNCIHTKVTSPNGTVKKSNEYKLGANNRQIASFGFVYLF